MYLCGDTDRALSNAACLRPTSMAELKLVQLQCWLCIMLISQVKVNMSMFLFMRVFPGALFTPPNSGGLAR